MKKWLKLFTVYLLVFLLAGCASEQSGGLGELSVVNTDGSSNIGGETESPEKWALDSTLAWSDDEDTGQPDVQTPNSDTDLSEEDEETTGGTAGEDPNSGGAESNADDSEEQGAAGTDDAEISEAAETEDVGILEASGSENTEIPGSDEGGAFAGNESASEELPEDGIYTTKEDVALYIYLYGQLPSNFITKKEAEKLGWKGGSLEPYAPDKCIGGSRFGNYEGLLPEKEGRTYTECDIDTLGADKRGAKRIVFSNDGLIYYTEDHYETFELLYGDE